MREKNMIYDVLIIGGGIAGAGIARDATLRGMHVVLLEKNTYGSGTSSKSSKLIHGGIRYLDVAKNHFLAGRFREGFKNFFFVFKALRETSILEKTCGCLVTPLTLTIPIYQKRIWDVWGVYFGSLLYSFMSILAGNFKAPRLLLTRKAVLKRLPNLNPEGLRGGVVIWDHTTNDQKLVSSIIQSATQKGLQAYEHSQVTSYTYQKESGLYEVLVNINGEEALYQAKTVVNASGAWVDQVREMNGERSTDYIVPIAGTHITLKPFTRDSMVLKADDNRTFFIIHRENVARIGTTERHHTNPDHVEASEEEINYLIESLDQYFPSLQFKKEDILKQDAGIRPLAKPEVSMDAHNISREHEVRVGDNGVMHILGVKLTDHRRAAEQVVDLLVKKLDPSGHQFRKHSETSKTPLSR